MSVIPYVIEQTNRGERPGRGYPDRLGADAEDQSAAEPPARPAHRPDTREDRRRHGARQVPVRAAGAGLRADRPDPGPARKRMKLEGKQWI